MFLHLFICDSGGQKKPANLRVSWAVASGRGRASGDSSSHVFAVGLHTATLDFKCNMFTVFKTSNNSFYEKLILTVPIESETRSIENKTLINYSKHQISVSCTTENVDWNFCCKIVHNFF